MTVPLLLQFVSTIYKWTKIEKHRDKKWSWIFLILQLWPQLRAIRVIRLLYKNDPNANDRKKEFNSEVGCTEPFLEAWPSFIIMTIICFSTLAGPDQGVNQEAVFGNSLAKFFAAYGISAFSCCFGITKLLQIGPCPVLSEEGILGGVFNCRFIIHFLAVMSSALTKAVCVAFVIVISKSNYVNGIPIYGNGLPNAVRYSALLLLFLPNLALSIFSIAKSTGFSKNFSEVVLRYPALWLLPVATYFAIGPQDITVANCLCNNKSVNYQHLGISGSLTAFNMAFTFGLYIPTILLGFPMDYVLLAAPLEFFTPFVLVLVLGWIFTGASFKYCCSPDQYKMNNHYINVDRDHNRILIRQKDVEKQVRSPNDLK